MKPQTRKELLFAIYILLAGIALIAGAFMIAYHSINNTTFN